MRHRRVEDPAEIVLAWEAVEELLASIPESSAKDVLRMVAAGLPLDEIAERLGLAVADVEVLAARGRIRILTAAIHQQAGLPEHRDIDGRVSNP
jgi:DNA-directed RNA polymerase specialized sigma24 family protein